MVRMREDDAIREARLRTLERQNGSLTQSLEDVRWPFFPILRVRIDTPTSAASTRTREGTSGSLAGAPRQGQHRRPARPPARVGARTSPGCRDQCRSSFSLLFLPSIPYERCCRDGFEARSSSSSFRSTGSFTRPRSFVTPTPSTSASSTVSPPAMSWSPPPSVGCSTREQGTVFRTRTEVSHPHISRAVR